MSNIDVDAESTGVAATLPIGVPVINAARPHELMLPITDNALENVCLVFHIAAAFAALCLSCFERVRKPMTSKSHGSLKTIGGPVLGSLYEGILKHWNHFGSMVRAPDVWKLPHRP